MSVDYDKIIHAIIDPLLVNPNAVLIRQLPTEKDNQVDFVIATEKCEIARLIGRKGIIANSIREVVSIGGKKDNKHIHIRFETLGDDDEKEDKED